MTAALRTQGGWVFGLLASATACGPEVSGASASAGGSGSDEASQDGDATLASSPDNSDAEASADGASGEGSGGETGNPDGPRPDLDALRPCDGVMASWVAADGFCGGNMPCFTTIQAAVDVAIAGTTIWVGPGTYLPSAGALHVVESTSVPLCLRSSDGPTTTVLDGQSVGTVVLAGYDGPLWLEGFTVRGCGGADGADTLDGYGIAVGGWGELHGWIVNNIIEDNVVGRGAVLFTTSTVPSDADIFVSGNVVRRNAVDTIYGAAIWVELKSPSQDSGLVRIENNLVVDNDGGIGFFQYLYQNSPPQSVVQIQVVNNTVTSNERGMNLPVEALSLHGNIVYGNGTDIARLEEPLAPSVVDNVFGNAPVIPGGEGNIFEDPQFVDSMAGDYHLAATSPARDGETSTLAASFDLDGRERDAMPDVGAYEVP